MYLASTLSAQCLTEGCGVLSELMLVSCCCAATNLTAAQFRVLLCRVPSLQIRRNQLPPRVGRETLDRFFHGWRQVPPPINNVMHRFFDGSQHFLYRNFTVGSRHSTVASFFQQIGRHQWAPCTNW